MRGFVLEPRIASGEPRNHRPWRGFFDFQFSASEVANGKPAPDLFLHAAVRRGLKPAIVLWSRIRRLV
jgi:FMN phosphatase YigB (HAD superfamily)